MLETVLVVALACSFVLSVVDYWLPPDLRPVRILAALVAATAASASLGWRGGTLAVLAAAGTFLAVSVVSLIEWVLTTPRRVR